MSGANNMSTVVLDFLYEAKDVIEKATEPDNITYKLALIDSAMNWLVLAKKQLEQKEGTNGNG